MNAFSPLHHEKTIATEVMEFINDEVHPDCMEVRDGIEDKEHCYTENGEEIVCSVCGTAWLQEEEGEFTFGTCAHLRFTSHSEGDDDFEFFGEWDAEGFMRLVEEAREKDADGEMDILDILGKIRHPDIDKGIIYIWYGDPLSHPWMIWGYKSLWFPMTKSLYNSL